MLITDPAVRSAARFLFGAGALVNEQTITRFEHVYNCKIQRTKHEPGLIPTIKFNTEQDEIMFILRWS